MPDDPVSVPDVERASTRRQRAAVVAAPVVAVVAVTCLAVAAQGGFRTSAPKTSDPQRTSAPDGGNGPLPTSTGPWGTIKSAVVRASPVGLDFADLDRVEGAGGLTLDGNVDDGHGRGRLLVVVVPAAQGGIKSWPCADLALHGDGACTTDVLPDGTTLTRQGPSGANGFLVENVMLVHPDGSAVLVEADNALIPPMSSTAPLTPAGTGQAALQITRSLPVYGLEQLTAVARAVDAASVSLR